MKTQSSNSSSVQPQVIIVKSQKSIGFAIILTLFLGPLGMLYSTVAGAIVMFFINLLMLFFTAGLGLFLTLPIGIVWAAISARNTHTPVQGSAIYYN